MESERWRPARPTGTGSDVVWGGAGGGAVGIDATWSERRDARGVRTGRARTRCVARRPIGPWRRSRPAGRRRRPRGRGSTTPNDEGELTLSLSNASGGRVTDDETTGTIVNSDPLPRALLARFGRTAALQVVEQVEERLEAAREPGFRGRVDDFIEATASRQAFEKRRPAARRAGRRPLARRPPGRERTLAAWPVAGSGTLNKRPGNSDRGRAAWGHPPKAASPAAGRSACAVPHGRGRPGRRARRPREPWLARQIVDGPGPPAPGEFMMGSPGSSPTRPGRRLPRRTRPGESPSNRLDRRGRRALPRPPRL